MRQILFHLPVLDIPIYGFGLMMVLGFLSGIWLARRRAVSIGMDPDLISNVGMIALLGGIGGCRVFHVIHHWSTEFAPVFANEGFGAGMLAVINIRSGGLEYFGEFLTVVAIVWLYCRIKGIKAATLLDICVASMALGHAFGRMGCFLNGCCYGAVCAPDNPLGVTFPKVESEGRVLGSPPFVDHMQEPHRWVAHIPGVEQWSLPVHPTQLYELVGDLLLAALLTSAFAYRRRAGETTALYFVLYAVMRFTLEFVRTEPREFFGGTTTVHQLISIVMFTVAGTYWLYCRLGPAPAVDPNRFRTGDLA